MSDYPYAQTPAKLESMLESVQSVGIPGTASSKWLKSIGFTSSNDRSMLRVLKFIGFLDSSSVPTETWQSYRDRGRARQVLAESIRNSYSGLFEQFRDAETRSHEDLTNFFAAQTTLSKDATQRMVKTFLTLCSMADFSAASDNGVVTSGNGDTVSADVSAPLVAPPPSIESPTPMLHIDFQFQIGADTPAEKIDQIFESVAKHLYNK